MTGEDLSVLVVDPAGASEELRAQLEFLNVAVEQSRPEDLEALLPLVEPDLVVHYGSASVESSVEMLRKRNPEFPTRLLIVAARDELPELRKLDRKVVISIVATDISAKVIASRLVRLAQKSQVVEAALSNQHQPLTLAEGQDDEDTVDFQFIGPITSSTPPPEVPTVKTGPRIVVCADKEKQRHQLVRYLGSRASNVMGTSLSVTETDWSQIRNFAPDYFVVDSVGLRQGDGVWLDMLKADKDFASDQLFELNFDEVFDAARLNHLKVESSLAPLLQKLLAATMHSDAAVVEMSDEDRITIEAAFERPTVSHASIFSDEHESPTERIQPTPEKTIPRSAFPFPKKSSQASEPKRRTGLALGALAFVACSLWLITRLSTPGEEEPLLAKSDESRDRVSVPKTPTKVTEDTKASASVDPENLWATPAQKQLPPCDELIADKEALKLGGMAQAKLSWSEAKTALMRGELDRAQLLLCEAVAIHPESLAWEGLIDLAITQGAPQSASLWVERALALRGQRGRTLMLVGDIQSQLGQVQKSRATWAQALEVDPNDVKTLRQVGAQYRAEATGKLKSGDLANAERLLRRAATLDPTDPLALGGLAECRWALKDEVQAKAWAQQALVLDDGQQEALVVLADISFAKNQTSEAKKLYEKALERSPSHKHARVQLHKISQIPSASAESTHTQP